MLDKTIPRNNCAPFDVQLGPTCVNLLLFVHNVPGLDRGFYFYFRSEERAEAVRGRAILPSCGIAWKQENPFICFEKGIFGTSHTE
ncbi:MAG TPA: hypothetical protein VEF34_19660 [Syntrophobacteraceae bacterium]|nr:hypothetical protein [Syntrophobacteraceae bacterium]